MSVDNNSKDNILKILSEVPDPEIPVISLQELGIIRDVKITDNLIEIIITHTYSGCPANSIIELEIRTALLKNGIENFIITLQLSPPWSTDNISPIGLRKLKEYGIAPPIKYVNDINEEIYIINCPQCDSQNVMPVSNFGSTACKALYKCNDCKEPFDYFKCI
ncbi:MAG: phenylacetate-CoA oxygenase subunit PaaJ [Bacteroidetes bacterium]|nr:phenylacetate-CoA oxygenase subunit PaaJ [Bacteroidota bacterium]